MRLKKYNEKRDFSKTDEPEGKVQKSSQKRFVIQFHRARRDHYDFRLEHNGVLVSWAIPKGLSENHKDKRLAVKVEDHPLDYISFEGRIPKGQYGAGTVEIWDDGVYQCEPTLSKGLKEGSFKVALIGKKLQGIWAFVKMEGDNWLAIYEKAQPQKSAQSKEKTIKTLKKSLNRNPFDFAPVKLALLSEKIPKGKDWAFEIKYDGYRTLAFVENGKVILKSRNNKDFTQKFKSLCAELSDFANENSAVFDGEVVVFDENGRSDFSLLQQAVKNGKGQLFYVIFDILALNGEDLRAKPLKERRKALETFKKFPPHILLSQQAIDKGKESFALAKKLNLEGIVAKNLNSLYDGQRNEDWQKIKCYKKQEFVIGGFETSDKNQELSAILLGAYKKGLLIYYGKVGTGFDDEERKNLRKKFDKIVVKTSPFDNSPNLKHVIFVKPKLVAEIKFAELTKEKNIRQGAFMGFREDKNAKDVVLEI